MILFGNVCFNYFFFMYGENLRVVIIGFFCGMKDGFFYSFLGFMFVKFLSIK